MFFKIRWLNTKELEKAIYFPYLNKENTTNL